MWPLTFFLWVGSGAALVVLVNGELRRRIELARGTLERLEEQRRECERRLESSEKMNLERGMTLSRTITMYETVRDICASLDEDQMKRRFEEDLSRAKGDEAYRRVMTQPFELGLSRARLYRMVQELAMTDSLTGVVTRRYAIERLKEECQRSLAHGFPLSFLMIDVDDFKLCNDTYGHLVGDIILSEIAHRIKEAVREVDLLARFGGEEFMVLAPNTSKEGATAIAERIRQQVAS